MEPTWNPSAIQKHPTRWRFNMSLLKDPEFDSYFKREWTSFLEINDSPKSFSITALGNMESSLMGENYIIFSTLRHQVTSREWQSIINRESTLNIGQRWRARAGQDR